MVAAELEKMKTMSVKEFAGRMADVWMSSKVDADTYLRKALYLSVCDADRGMAFWREHTRRKGLRLDENTAMPDLFFQVVAYRNGKRFTELIMEACPRGPYNGLIPRLGGVGAE